MDLESIQLGEWILLSLLIKFTNVDNLLHHGDVTNMPADGIIMVGRFSDLDI
jgi:hypothetical protein